MLGSEDKIPHLFHILTLVYERVNESERIGAWFLGQMVGRLALAGEHKLNNDEDDDLDCAIDDLVQPLTK
jgi:hypothetical protein